MPTFAWLADDGKGGLEVSKPQPHTCFASVGMMPQRKGKYNQEVSSHHPEIPYIYWVASFGNYDETRMWADAVNACESLQEKVRFVLKPHPHDDPENPFANDKLMAEDPWGKKSAIHHTYCTAQDVCYWSISFQEGELWDYVFGVFKLIFKNITYGPRGGNFGNAHNEMISFLKQGATALEAIVYAGAYIGNGYNYPCKINKENVKKVLKFINEGPQFAKFEDGKGQTTGERLGKPNKYPYGIEAKHNPIDPGQSSFPLADIGGNNRVVTLEEFRKQLNRLAGVS